MKFAAIADVHGNCPALEAVLADIAALGITEVVNLGDHVRGPLEAARTADLLIERGFPSVRGDQDRRLVELWTVGTSARSDFRQLKREHFTWMATMPPTLVYREEVFLCHASPKDDSAFWLDYVTSDGGIRASPIEAIEPEADGINARVILCGHTHIPRVVRLRDGRLIVNPGSVGFARLQRANARSLHCGAWYAACVLRNHGTCPSRLVSDDPIRSLRQCGHGCLSPQQGYGRLGERDCYWVGRTGELVGLHLSLSVRNRYRQGRPLSKEFGTLGAACRAAAGAASECLEWVISGLLRRQQRSSFDPMHGRPLRRTSGITQLGVEPTDP